MWMCAENLFSLVHQILLGLKSRVSCQLGCCVAYLATYSVILTIDNQSLQVTVTRTLLLCVILAAAIVDWFGLRSCCYFVVTVVFFLYLTV